MTPNQASLSKIGITMGDPAGVGPEICLRALADASILAQCQPLVLGDDAVLRACAARTGLPAPRSSFSWSQLQEGTIVGPGVVDFGQISMAEFTPGKMNAATGRAAFTYVDRAIDAALAGQIHAMVTAPLNKEAMHLAGLKFPGHTEILAARTDAARSCMLQYSTEITCSFVTVHVGYHEVPNLLTIDRITDVIDLTVEALERISRSQSQITLGKTGAGLRLVVCGLNPHAGEHGLFGNREEERIIEPAMALARKRHPGVQFEGPVPPDTAFLPWKRKTTDAYICMYHDQGHIPLKALAFDTAVNTTLGLPIIRTSVDHGTALDIAWQGTALPDSLFSAIRLACGLAVG